jgi:hypothetical protein
MKIFFLIVILIFCNPSFAQSNSTLEDVLSKSFPENSQQHGRWAFDSKNANIEKLELLQLKKYFINHDFFMVSMANYDNSKKWTGLCVIIFNNVTKSYLFHRPLWSAGLDTPFITTLKSLQFKDSLSLLNFINEFHCLRQIGSKYKFIQVGVSDSLISYHLVFFRDQNFLTKPYTESKLREYTIDQLHGKFFIKIHNNRIVDYIELSGKSPLSNIIKKATG